MIEATCTACGNTHRLAEADVPAGAKFLTCTSCKARVALPSPSGVSAPSAGGGGALPRVPAPPPKPASRPDPSDLPAPKRPTPNTERSTRLGMTAPPLDLDLMPPDAAPDITDLPAPKAARPMTPIEAGRPPLADLPAPKSGRSTVPDLSSKTPAPVIDLPAPKGRAPGTNPRLSLSTPPSSLSRPVTSPRLTPPTSSGPPSSPRITPPPTSSGPPSSPRLTPPPVSSGPPSNPRISPPAPAATPPPPAGGIGELPASQLDGIGDLPAPKRVDLPAPKRALSDLPVPLAGLADLPAPREPVVDMLAPKPTKRGIVEPKQAIENLPAPKPGITDLPAPKSDALELADLPAPVAKAPGVTDLPAPQGFFDDLPQPVRGGAAATAVPDLPAPQGFFDDLPQPVRGGTAAPAPAVADLPAPQGFFDDIPGRPNQAKPQPAEPPAPKGFFDDIPGRPNQAKPQPAEPPAPKGFFDDVPGRPNQARPEPPAPKGFFDDVPGRPNQARPEPPAPKGFFDDLPQPARTPPPQAPPPVAPQRMPVMQPMPAPPDLGGLGPAPPFELTPHPQRFDELSFSSANTTPPLKIDMTSPPIAEIPGPVSLDDPPEEPTVAPKPSKREPAPRLADPVLRARRGRRVRIALVALLAVAGLGAGGFVLYRRHLEKQERLAEIGQRVDSARAALSGKDAKRWERAAALARAALELDEHNAEALGIGAEALLADGLAFGVNAAGKATQARRMLATAAQARATGPALDRAQALAAATGRPPDPAKLEKLAAAAPSDPTLALYLGWALAARGDAQAADAAFTKAAAVESMKLPALLGRGWAKLALADTAGARADFTAVLAIAKDHLAAQVGLAAARPASQAQQQEDELVALLARKDLASADPRAVVQAWVLAGDAARRGGRLDAARERYRKALALADKDVAAMTGLAELEISEGKLDTAVETIEKALAIDPHDARAQLVSADIAIRQKRLDDAAAKLQALASRKPALPKLEQARLRLGAGRLLEAQGQDTAAVDSFIEGAQLAGELDLAPALAAVTKLGKLADAATDAKDFEKAAALRARGEQLIASFAENARTDPQIALSLGMAYLEASDAAQAEPWLRRAVDARPTDVLARSQLAKTLALLERYDDAIEAFQRTMKLDEERVEIALELARTYEAAHRDTDAGQLYGKLLAAKDPSLEVRARAGRFYARTGDAVRAGEQGEKISAADPTHPTGLYLRAEGALAAGRTEEAAKLFRAAVDGDRDPQFLDGQGRASEALVAQTGDTKFQDAALRAYMAAAEIAPAMFNPQVGQGRLYVARREAAKAIPPLLTASKLRPDDPEVTRLIGLAYKELQERRVAIEWLARAYKLAPSADAAWNLGQLYIEENSPKDAIAAFTNATRLGLEDEKRTGATLPWMTEALYRLGRIHMDSSNERAAKSAWLKYIARTPKAGPQLDEVRRELATTLQRY